MVFATEVCGQVKDELKEPEEEGAVVVAVRNEARSEGMVPLAANAEARAAARAAA